jgi:hypothetical protein
MFEIFLSGIFGGMVGFALVELKDYFFTKLYAEIRAAVREEIERAK